MFVFFCHASCILDGFVGAFPVFSGNFLQGENIEEACDKADSVVGNVWHVKANEHVIILVVIVDGGASQYVRESKYVRIYSIFLII